MTRVLFFKTYLALFPVIAFAAVIFWGLEQRSGAKHAREMLVMEEEILANLRRQNYALSETVKIQSEHIKLLEKAR